MSWPIVAAVAAAAWAVTVPLVHLARRFAVFADIVDYPNSRSSHLQPVPRGGGFAMVASTLGLLAVTGWWFPDVVQPYWIGVAVAAVLVALISAIDDWKGLPAPFRLVIHIVAAAVAWHAASRGVIVSTESAWAAAAGFLAVVWLAGMINAYNFMDGIDGLAAGTAVVAGLAWMGLGLAAGLMDVALAGAAAAGACAAFLLFNWSPARVFMGDVGSAFLGYWFGILAVVGGRHQRLLFVQGALIMWPFVFDTVTTMTRRLWRGENPMTPHRTHLYQRLIVTGLGHAEVALLYVGLAATGALAAGLVSWRPQLLLVWALIPAISAAALWTFVVLRERSAVAGHRSRA